MFLGRDGAMIILSEDGGESGIPFTLEALTQACIIFVMGVAIIVSNVLIIASLLTHHGRGSRLGQKEAINYYLLSLAVADLLIGVLVVPLSVYPAIAQQWVYGDVVCRLAGYVEVTLWSVSMYTFMWISVDRYLAIRKPLRYETVQTKTRCQCWMVFTWISAVMLCCPPLLGFNKPLFDRDAYVCMLDWGNMMAYSVTIAILVLGPSLITIVYTYSYIFMVMRRIKNGVPMHDKEYATALTENLSNPSHVMSFVLIVAFWLSWTPYAVIRLYEYFTGFHFQVPFLHFSVVWLGILNSFWKSLIYVSMSPHFRLGMRIFCMSLCCRYKARQRELMDDD
ncbi:G-protein coupled receptor 52 isoform X1 [Ischnura elegans]|uniref:G-protein coupled receptor 52 isoform X1 n=1 Tax=Ischnura elegans TaxID=197161 RepID=UPI001ED89621|nr:G-protein coupled receptor 52 isoform X1 [Ischnura elegans]